MRLVFTTKLTVDVAPHDDALRRAFTKLVKQAARQVYGPSAMLSKGDPKIELTLTSREGEAKLDMMQDISEESN